MRRRTSVLVCVVTAVLVTVSAIVGEPERASAGALPPATTTTSANASGSPGSGSTTPVACKPSTLKVARTVVGNQLSDRVAELELLAARVSATKDIPSTDVPVLNGILMRELATIAGGGIKGLETAVAKAPTCASLLGDARTMLKDFWVYALVSPQVDLTAVASVESAIESQLIAIEPKINTAISDAAAKRAGRKRCPVGIQLSRIEPRRRRERSQGRLDPDPALSAPVRLPRGPLFDRRVPRGRGCRGLRPGRRVR